MKTLGIHPPWKKKVITKRGIRQSRFRCSALQLTMLLIYICRWRKQVHKWTLYYFKILLSFYVDITCVGCTIVFVPRPTSPVWQPSNKIPRKQIRLTLSTMQIYFFRRAWTQQGQIQESRRRNGFDICRTGWLLNLTFGGNYTLQKNLNERMHAKSLQFLLYRLLI